MGRHAIERGRAGATLSGEYFETDFAAFLAWRDFGFPDLDGRQHVLDGGAHRLRWRLSGRRNGAPHLKRGRDLFPRRHARPQGRLRWQGRSDRERAARTERRDRRSSARSRLRFRLDRRLRPAPHRLHEDHAARRAGRGGEGAHRSVPRQGQPTPNSGDPCGAQLGDIDRRRTPAFSSISSTTLSLRGRPDSRDACAIRRSRRAPVRPGRRRIPRRPRRFLSSPGCRPTSRDCPTRHRCP